MNSHIAIVIDIVITVILTLSCHACLATIDLVFIIYVLHYDSGRDCFIP